MYIYIYWYMHIVATCRAVYCFNVCLEDKTPLCQLSSKRFEDNWHSGLVSSTKHRLL